MLAVLCVVLWKDFKLLSARRGKGLFPEKKGLSRVSDGGAAREVARVRSLFLSGRKSGKWRARARAIRRRRWRRSIDQMKHSAFDEYKARREESRATRREEMLSNDVDVEVRRWGLMRDGF